MHATCLQPDKPDTEMFTPSAQVRFVQSPFPHPSHTLPILSTRSFAWAAAALLSTCATAYKALANGIAITAIPHEAPLSRLTPRLKAAASRDVLLKQLTEPSLLSALADCIRASTSATSPSSPSPSLPCHGGPHLGLLAWSARLLQDLAWSARHDMVSYRDAVASVKDMRDMGGMMAAMAADPEPRHVAERLVAALASSRVLEAMAEALLALPPLPEDSGGSGGGCDAGCVLVPGVGCGRVDAAELVCAVCSLGSCCHSLGVLLGEVGGGEGALRHEPLRLQLAGALMAPAVGRLMECMVRRAVGEVEGGGEGRSDGGNGTCGWALLDALKLTALVDEALMSAVPPAKLFGVEQLSVRGDGMQQQQQQQKAPGVGRELAHATLLCGGLTVWTCALRLRLRNPGALAAASATSSGRANSAVQSMLTQLSAMAPDPAASMEATCAALRATCLLYRTHPRLCGRPPCGAVQTLWALRAPMPNVYGCRVRLNLKPFPQDNPFKFPLTIKDSVPVLSMELLAPEHVSRCLPAALEAVAWGLAAACDIGLQERAGAASAKEVASKGPDRLPEWSRVAKSLVAGLWAAVGAVGQGCASVDAADVAQRLGRARLLRSLDTFVRLFGDAVCTLGMEASFVLPELASALRALCALPLPLVPGAVPQPWGGAAAGVPGARLAAGVQQQQQQAGDLCGLLLSLGKWVRATGAAIVTEESMMRQVAAERQRQMRKPKPKHRQQQEDEEEYTSHMYITHIVDELVGGMAVAVDRAARLAGEMEGAAAAAAAAAGGGGQVAEYCSPADAAAGGTAAASLRGCVIYACRAACWAAAPRLHAACRVLRELPEDGRWPDLREPDLATLPPRPQPNFTGLPPGARMVMNPNVPPPKRGDPSLQQPKSYPTRAAYVQAAVNTLSTTAGWLGCPLGAWLGEWRQLQSAEPLQLVEDGCRLVTLVAEEVVAGKGAKGGLRQEQLMLAVQGAGALQQALLGLAAHGDDATVNEVREWIEDIAAGGGRSGAGGQNGGFELADLLRALEDAVGAAGKAGGPGVEDLQRAAGALSQLLQGLRGSGGQVEELRRVAQQVRATSGAEGSSGGGAAQRVWGREQAEAAARVAGEVWWPRACAYPECRNFREATEAELKPKLCGGCGETRYCRPECQKLHWKTAHKQECKRKGG